MAPSDYVDAVAALVSAMTERLLDQGFEHQARLLASHDEADVAPALDAGSDLPVLAQMGAAITTAAEHGEIEVAESVRVLAPRAPWTRTAAYVREPPNDRFLDGYAHVTLSGARDGAGAAPGGTATLGLLLLGADVDYPPHHHPADEVYLPLTPARWLDGSGPGYRPRPAGTALHHRPWQPHGMRTGNEPLLAVYVWSGAVVSPSRFC